MGGLFYAALDGLALFAQGAVLAGGLGLLAPCGMGGHARVGQQARQFLLALLEVELVGLGLALERGALLAQHVDAGLAFLLLGQPGADALQGGAGFFFHLWRGAGGSALHEATYLVLDGAQGQLCRLPLFAHVG